MAVERRMHFLTHEERLEASMVMQATHQSGPEVAKLLVPGVDLDLDGGDQLGGHDGGDGVEALVEDELDVVDGAQDKDVLLVLVRNHRELQRLPRLLHLLEEKSL